MNAPKANKPFIPRDKPKSWIVFICTGLIAVLVAGPIAISGSILEIKSLKMTGVFLFMFCWVTMFVMFVVGMISRIMGKWKNIQEREWKDQVW